MKIRVGDHEVHKYGPITLERNGRVLRMGSDLGEAEFESHLKKMRESRPRLKGNINNNIAELLEIIDKYDPLELLAIVSMTNCFGDPEEYTEITHQGKESYAEYALSLVLGKSRKSKYEHASKEAIKRFSELIEKIYQEVAWYFGTETVEHKRNWEDDRLRFHSIVRFLHIRGDSYPEHHVEMVLEIFSEHDNFFEKHYGFSARTFISAIQELEDQVIDNINNGRKRGKALIEHYNKFQIYVAKKGKKAFESEAQAMEMFRKEPGSSELEERVAVAFRDISKNPFEIIPNNSVKKEALDLICAVPGDNYKFVDFNKSPGWPTNDSIIFEFPVLRWGEKYYCFSPQVPFRSLMTIFERLIRDADSRYYAEIYLEKRGKYLENKAIQYIKNIFPTAQVYKGLFYRVEEKGIPVRAETDGIILFDENIFILEAKSGEISLSAKRGSLERIRRDLSSIVDEAYTQALRTKNFIENSETPIFEDEKGQQVLRLTDKQQYKNVFLINVTLQYLGPYATQLNSIKRLGLLEGKEWPYSIFINDLRIISELCEFPSQYLHYLKKRIRLNDYPQFQAEDELDIFMYYLNQEFFPDELPKEYDNIALVGYTEQLDRYYDLLAGRVSSGEKPKQKIPQPFKSLIQEIENTNKLGFSKLTTRLLDLSVDAQQQVLQYIQQTKQMHLRDGRDHDFSMEFRKANWGLTICTTAEINSEILKRLEAYCRIKMYETRAEEWAVIPLKWRGENSRVLDFEMFEGKWIFDEELEKETRNLKGRKIAFQKISAQKIGRNDPCPCGSGKKFKKCCIDKVKSK